MWPRNNFLELLGIAYPIVQAPTAGFTTPALTAAVCNAGALGSIGCATLPAAAIREQVAAAGQATNRLFNMNFFVMHLRPPHPRRRRAFARYSPEFGLGSRLMPFWRATPWPCVRTLPAVQLVEQLPAEAQPRLG